MNGYSRIKLLVNILFAFLFISCSHMVMAGTLAINNTKVAPNETISITSYVASGDRDWVGIYHKGDSNAWSNVLSWGWVNNGTSTLDGVAATGEYEARLFFHNSFNLQSSVSFDVSSTSMATSKTNYSSNESINITLSGLSGDRDWVGIYHKGDSNAWANVLSWGWANDNALTLDGIPSTGDYEARLFFHNSYNVAASHVFKVRNRENPLLKIGADFSKVTSTPLNKGKLFASVNGNGNCMSQYSPCKIDKAFRKLSKTSNVLFLDGGVYHIKNILDFGTLSGTKNNPIIVESWPGRGRAILSGDATIAKIKSNQCASGGISIKYGAKQRYIKIRNLDITKMGGRGIYIEGTGGVTLEGNKIHHNFLSGISLYRSSNNTIINNMSYENSDVGLNGQYENRGYFANGDTADGIQIIRDGFSTGNSFIHNTTNDNSDDGIDVFGGTNSIIKYNLAFANKGVAGQGNGIGIKACSIYSNGLVAEHNIAYGNKGNGFECLKNNGVGVSFKYNTSFNNKKGYGFAIAVGSQATLSYNISSQNKYKGDDELNGIQQHNSWQINPYVPFINTNPNLTNFLKPKAGSSFENMGAYANP